MNRIAPSEKDAANDTLEKRLWAAADQLRANSGLTSQQYSLPVLGLIFLRFAEVRFSARRAVLEKAETSGRRASRVDDPTAYHAEGVIYLSAKARFATLLNLPEGADVGKAVNDAMADIEKQNPQLAGVLPRTYQVFTSTLLKELLKKVSEIPATLAYDAFGRVYEYFLGEFAMTEGQQGGEFYTPSSIVRLLVEILEPYHGRILDPACGSGGMFVQSARFVAEHRNAQTPSPAASRHPLPVGEGRGEGHKIESHGRFDFVLANPPFNVDAVDKERLAAEVGPGRRYPFGLPRTDNANYLWIQLFYSALNAKGRAGFVMANSAADARSSEQEIRKQLIQARVVDVIVAVGPNMFYTVTLPCTLWFFDKGRDGSTSRPKQYRDSVLFIDARHIYRQIDRAHRDWTPAQIGFLGNLVRLYRGEELDFTLGGDEAKAKLEEVFRGEHAPSRVVDRALAVNSENPAVNSERSARARNAAPGAGALPIQYRDVPGFCRAATQAEIEAQGWSLNPGRYVGVAPGEEVTDEDFKEQLETQNEELETLNAQARQLEKTIAKNVAEILEA